MAVFRNNMAAKDLLPKMLELRGRNYTYKKIGEELGISASLVGKHLKEVRDKPELAFEFIELKNFETGQTVLSFTPENFEKYRQSTTMYYLGNKVFEIKSGLIHKTDFTTYITGGGLETKPPEWYSNVTKLYSDENWHKPIQTKMGYNIKLDKRREITDSYVANYIVENSLPTNKRNEAGQIACVLTTFLNIKYSELYTLSAEIDKAPTEKHWFNDEELIAQCENAEKLVKSWQTLDDDDALLEYAINLLPHGITIESMLKDINIGWNISDLGRGRNGQRVPPKNGFENWVHCNEFSISLDDWNRMLDYQISDIDYFKQISPWIKTDIKRAFSIFERYSSEGEFSVKTWKEAAKKNVIDQIITSMQNLGWTPEAVDKLTILTDYVGGNDGNLHEFISSNSIETINKALDGVSYLTANELDKNPNNRDWLVNNRWEIPKLKEGFMSYVAVDIYNEIKKSKNNYIDIEELQEIYELDTRPKYSSSWREFVKREINMTPALQKIWNFGIVRGFSLIIKKPVTAALLEKLHKLGFSFDELKQMDLKKITKLMEYLQQRDIEFNQEFALWAYKHDWNIPELGSFKSYRELRLFKHLSSMIFPSYRLDKMLIDFNEFSEPGPIALSEQELHAILIQEPFSKICISSEEAGMVQLKDIEFRNQLEPIIIEKIVEIEKEVIVKEELIVEVESKKATKRILDYSRFAELDSKSIKMNMKIKDSIDRGDLDDAIVKSITRFEFWAKKLWKENKQESVPRGKDAGKILMETVADIMQFDSKVKKNLKLARIARNNEIHSENSGITGNKTHLKYVLKATEEIISKLS